MGQADDMLVAFALLRVQQDEPDLPNREDHLIYPCAVAARGDGDVFATMLRLVRRGKIAEKAAIANRTAIGRHVYAKDFIDSYVLPQIRTPDMARKTGP